MPSMTTPEVDDCPAMDSNSWFAPRSRRVVQAAAIMREWRLASAGLDHGRTTLGPCPAKPVWGLPWACGS